MQFVLRAYFSWGPPPVLTASATFNFDGGAVVDDTLTGLISGYPSSVVAGFNAGGTITSDPITIAVEVDISSLAPGTHTASVQYLGPSANTYYGIFYVYAVCINGVCACQAPVDLTYSGSARVASSGNVRAS